MFLLLLSFRGNILIVFFSLHLSSQIFFYTWENLAFLLSLPNRDLFLLWYMTYWIIKTLWQSCEAILSHSWSPVPCFLQMASPPQLASIEVHTRSPHLTTQSQFTLCPAVPPAPLGLTHWCVLKKEDWKRKAVSVQSRGYSSKPQRDTSCPWLEMTCPKVHLRFPMKLLDISMKSEVLGLPALELKGNINYHLSTFDEPGTS